MTGEYLADLYLDEIVIDSFAGGGGTSEGIVAALGRDPDIAVNHDRYALAMHRMNHPDTHHMVEDVITVDSVGMCAGRPIGMLWMSPDCKDHSKAKGGKPRDKNIRGLAWAVFGWVKALPGWQRPRVVFLENVEEFQDWAPLNEHGKRCPVQRGATFKLFVASWEALGYVVEWRERRAWRAGRKMQAATIRKRLYLIARRDGEPIVWPEPTRGNPDDPADAAKIAAGQLTPWKTAADCIDWSLPCPSIFDTSAEIKAKYGLRANRPLVKSTMARLAKGTFRYVLDAARPFIVPITHKGKGPPRAHCADEPLRTITTARRGELALAVPELAPARCTCPTGCDCQCPEPDDGVAGCSMHCPVHNDLPEPYPDCPAHGGGEAISVVAPFVTKFQTGSTGSAADEPLHTITSHASEHHGGGAAPAGVVSAFMVPRYQEREGQAPRTRSVEEPMGTVVPDGNEGHLAAVHLATMRNSQKPFNEPDKPMHTLTAGGANIGVVAAFIAQHTAGSHPGAPAKAADEPISTITAKGCQQSLAVAHMVNLHGADRRDSPADQPLPTITAGGTHAARVMGFLAKYYGEGLPSQGADEPLHTVTAKPRHGLVQAVASLPPFGPEHHARARDVADFLRAHGYWDDREFVTVKIDGLAFVLTDLGMRMLTARERFTAQGFRPDYIIDRGILEDGTEIRFTAEQQGYMCGNSVCPPESEDLIRANYVPRRVRAPQPRRRASFPLLEAAE